MYWRGVGRKRSEFISVLFKPCSRLSTVWKIFALSDVETVSGYCFSSNALLGIVQCETKGFTEFITYRQCPCDGIFTEVGILIPLWAGRRRNIGSVSEFFGERTDMLWGPPNFLYHGFSWRFAVKAVCLRSWPLASTWCWKFIIWSVHPFPSIPRSFDLELLALLLMSFHKNSTLCSY
jgi:hypothetical protein